MEIPIIRIELQGMKESIQQALAVHNDEFNTMISAAVDKAFDVETIQAKIDASVQQCLNDSIEALSGHYRVRELITELVVQSLEKKRGES